jgi:hypothetical protein
MMCERCGQADYVYEGLGAQDPLGRWRCPKCRHLQGAPVHASRINPIAQALLARVAQTAVRAGARGLGAAADSVAEEGEELLEQLGQKAIDFGKKIREARTKRGGS